MEPKTVYACRDIEDGSYKIHTYSKTTFRGKNRTYIHIQQIDKKWKRIWRNENSIRVLDRRRNTKNTTKHRIR